MEDIKFKVSCKRLDGSIEVSDVSVDADGIEYQNSSIPSPNDPFSLDDDAITISSYEDIKPFIVEEDDTTVCCDFKGKVVIISIQSTDDTWVKAEDDSWKWLYIAGILLYGVSLATLSVDEIGYTFGVRYGKSPASVVIMFDDTHESNICVIDRYISALQDY